MSMSRKDFVAIAEAIRGEVDCVNPDLEYMRLSSLKTVASQIARHAKGSNSNFDRPKFMAACGFDQFN